MPSRDNLYIAAAEFKLGEGVKKIDSVRATIQAYRNAFRIDHNDSRRPSSRCEEQRCVRCTVNITVQSKNTAVDRRVIVKLRVCRVYNKLGMIWFILPLSGGKQISNLQITNYGNDAEIKRESSRHYVVGIRYVGDLERWRSSRKVVAAREACSIVWTEVSEVRGGDSLHCPIPCFNEPLTI
jgi:hypothetical protein